MGTLVTDLEYFYNTYNISKSKKKKFKSNFHSLFMDIKNILKSLRIKQTM